jgi:hypothetical protein
MGMRVDVGQKISLRGKRFTGCVKLVN